MGFRHSDRVNLFVQCASQAAVWHDAPTLSSWLASPWFSARAESLAEPSGRYQGAFGCASYLMRRAIRLEQRARHVRVRL